MRRGVVAGTYIPRKEVAVLETIKATVIRENQAIRLRARKEGVDRGGVRRVTGNTPRLPPVKPGKSNTGVETRLEVKLH